MKGRKNMKYIILGHENPDVDSIVSGYLVEKVLKKIGYDAEYVIPDTKVSSDVIDIVSEYNFMPQIFQKTIDLNDDNACYILVDHNTRNFEGKVIAIIDHHPADENFENVNYYRNEAASSTACMIAKDNEKYLDVSDIELAVLATLVDTASFHSTKTRESDKEWVNEVCKKYNLDYDKLYKSGLCLTTLEDIDSASLNGLKKYEFNGKIVQSSYIQIEKSLENLVKIEMILELLKKYVKVQNLDLFVFIVHDMIAFKTTVYKISESNIYVDSYDKYTSRGCQIMPKVEQELVKRLEN